MPPSTQRRCGDFAREASARFRADWLLKALALTGGFTAFFSAYFYVLRHRAFPLTIMPVTAVDRAIGFHPEALPLYLSLWVYVPLAFVLQRDRAGLRAIGVAAIALSVVGLGFFYRWPTAVPERGTDWSAYPAFSFLRNVDAAGNACPSLHVAFAVWTALCLGPLLREMRAGLPWHVGSWLWCGGIVYSTLAIGQHVALDAFAGGALGALVAATSLYRGR